jgi:hypothetical protein
MTGSLRYDELPRWRRSVALQYISNRLYEWRWILATRVLRSGRRGESSRLHLYRGNIIGLSDGQNRPRPEDPESN